jgi:hypothetical protein
MATVKVAAQHNRTVKALVFAYADALVAYHVANNSEKASNATVARATATLYDAQNALNAATLAKALSY